MIDLHKSPVKGAHGWAIVVGLILLVDLTAKDEQTLTAACHRAMKTHPHLVVSVLVLTLLHLTLGHTRYAKFDIYRLIELLRRWTTVLVPDYPTDPVRPSTA